MLTKELRAVKVKSQDFLQTPLSWGNSNIYV